MLISSITVLAIIIFAVIYHGRKGRKMRQRQLQGIANVQLVKQLITAVQQHRGLSSAWLSGDNEKYAALNQKKAEINAIRKKIEDTDLTQHNGRWESFVDHWGRLLRTNTDQDLDNNFSQHTNMISNLLYLLEDEAEYGLLNSASLPSLSRIGFVWRELVATTEVVGQSRAIGTSVATNQYCGSVDKVRLSFLEQYIKDSSKRILSDLPQLTEFQTEHQKLTVKANQCLNVLTDTITKELVNTDAVRIDHNQYFAIASDTISALDEIFSMQMKQLKTAI